MTTRYMMELQNELENKNRELSETHQHIFSSIRFAGMIQGSLMPDASLLNSLFAGADFKVIQQIGIGGDSVFIKQTGNNVMFGLFDCTGHGIPGAMLSISGSLILNELMTRSPQADPEVIVKELSALLFKTFRNDSYSIAHMEGSFFSFSTETGQLSYCGARAKGLYMKNDGSIMELASGKNALGELPAGEFERFELDYAKGAKLVLYSDGLTDQFGGDNNKKFTRSRLKKILVEHAGEDASTLCKTIEGAHNDWKNNNEQTDDVSFLVIKF
ncbi:MAG: protein serine/threonine phosphatase [Bacteroidetes bacterium]|nr:protein serine/threonine phosphatase [Bacteroidota bacterium]